MKNVNELTLIIVSFNNSEIIKKNLGYLNLIKDEFVECIIVDSCSTQSELELLKAFESDYSFVKLIRSDLNRGFGSANNLGLQHVATKYFAIINPDLFILRKHALSDLIENFEQDNCIACSPVLFRYSLDQDIPLKSIDSAGIVRRFLRYADRRDLSDFDGLKTSLVDALCGAFILMRTSDVERISDKKGQLFDEKIFMYKEDQELGIRIKSKGYTMTVFNIDGFFHCRGLFVRGEASYWQKQEAAKNELYMMVKHRKLFSLVSFMKYVIVRLFKV